MFRNSLLEVPLLNHVLSLVQGTKNSSGTRHNRKARDSRRKVGRLCRTTSPPCSAANPLEELNHHITPRNSRRHMTSLHSPKRTLCSAGDSNVKEMLPYHTHINVSSPANPKDPSPPCNQVRIATTIVTARENPTVNHPQGFLSPILWTALTHDQDTDPILQPPLSFSSAPLPIISTLNQPSGDTHTKLLHISVFDTNTNRHHVGSGGPRWHEG